MYIPADYADAVLVIGCTVVGLVFAIIEQVQLNKDVAQGMWKVRRRK